MLGTADMRWASQNTRHDYNAGPMVNIGKYCEYQSDRKGNRASMNAWNAVDGQDKTQRRMFLEGLNHNNKVYRGNNTVLNAYL